MLIILLRSSPRDEGKMLAPGVDIRWYGRTSCCLAITGSFVICFIFNWQTNNCLQLSVYAYITHNNIANINQGFGNLVSSNTDITSSLGTSLAQFIYCCYVLFLMSCLMYFLCCSEKMHNLIVAACERIQSVQPGFRPYLGLLKYDKI